MLALYCLKCAHRRQCIAQLCVAFVHALYCLKVAHRRLLQALLKHCPGMAQAHLLLAESHHLGGNSPVALRKVADVLHQAPDNISAHMLLTRIYLHQVSAFGHYMWELLERACCWFVWASCACAYAYCLTTWPNCSMPEGSRHSKQQLDHKRSTQDI